MDGISLMKSCRPANTIFSKYRIVEPHCKGSFDAMTCTEYIFGISTEEIEEEKERHLIFSNVGRLSMIKTSISISRFENVCKTSANAAWITSVDYMGKYVEMFETQLDKTRKIIRAHLWTH